MLNQWQTSNCVNGMELHPSTVWLCTALLTQKVYSTKLRINDKISFYFWLVCFSVFLNPIYLHSHRQFITPLQRQSCHFLPYKILLIMSCKQTAQNINIKWILKSGSSELNWFCFWHHVFLYPYLTDPEGVQSMQDWKLV